MADNEVKPFKFNEEQYEITRTVYRGILESLGVENPDAALEEIVSNPIKGKSDGMMFNRYIGSLFQGKTDEERDNARREAARKALEELPEDASPYVKGYLAEMTGEYIPFDTVLTAGIMVGEGKSLQMGCGEGKTGVLSFATFGKLSKDKKNQVFLTSSTPILAEEALDKTAFYDTLGVAGDIVLITPEGIKRPKFVDGKAELVKGKPVKEFVSFEGKSEEEIKALLEEAYSSRIVVSDNVTLMQHAMAGYLPEPKDGTNREVLADEADFVLLDSYRPLQKTSELSDTEISQRRDERVAAYEILQSVISAENLYVMDDENQYVDFTTSGQKLITKKINERFGENPNIDKNQIYDFVYDALVAQTVYRENRDYQILNDGQEIVSEDRASGVEIDLPQGVKQALEIKLKAEGKYKGEISQEKDVLDTLNVQSFFKESFNGRKHFVSGTLGVDSEEISEEISENFNIDKSQGDVYEIPPREKRIRIDQGKTAFVGKEEKRKAIIDNALQELKKGRPILIGTVSEEEIIALQEELSTRSFEDSKPRILIYTAASEKVFKSDKDNLSDVEFQEKYGVPKSKMRYIDEKTGKEVDVSYADFIKGEAGKENTITLGTSIIGRGTTIKTEKPKKEDKDNPDRVLTVDEKGGIHVIIDGLHETSSRNQEQYKARTARGTDAGSTIEFFCLEDIPEDMREELAPLVSNPDELYLKFYKKVDQRTKNVRDNVVKFVKETRESLKSIEDSIAISNPENKDKASALLASRAFAIRNRACGISSREQLLENLSEYSREIKAYEELYISKFSSEERGEEFDELTWLKENGYEDIAERHMPFSKEREEKIFTLAGIRIQSSDARTPEVNEVTKTTKQAIVELERTDPGRKVENQQQSVNSER